MSEIQELMSQLDTVVGTEQQRLDTLRRDAAALYKVVRDAAVRIRGAINEAASRVAAGIEWDIAKQSCAVELFAADRRVWSYRLYISGKGTLRSITWAPLLMSSTQA